MKNLDRKQKKEIIQKNLDNLKESASYIADSFFVKTGDTDFEKKFMKGLPIAINGYLEENKIDPRSYNRGLTYSIINKENNFTITF